MAVNSMVSGGCVVSGSTIYRSLLFSNTIVNTHSDVQDSVILPNVSIGSNCRIKRAIVDRGSIIPDGMEIGFDAEADKAQGFRVTPSGLRLVTADMLGQNLHFTR
jgi:glucose-1-phosphate adenylyltransferase